MKINIQQLERISFLEYWYKNTNELLEITNNEGTGTTEVKNRKLNMVFDQLLQQYEFSRNHCIIGCEIAQSFKIKLSTKENLISIAQAIWDKPEDFFDIEKDAYYEFLKYLWIVSPDFPEETRLTDIVKINKIK